MDKRPRRMASISCVGVGTVGRSWAQVFAGAGCDVRLYDPDQRTVESALSEVSDALSANSGRGAISGSTDLGEALDGADYVQESAPEVLDIKRALYAGMAKHAGPNVLFGSSTSTLPGASFLTDLPFAERALVAHPTNPPHLVPLVELCRHPGTSVEAFDEVRALMSACGQVPVEIRKDLPGFVLNRLQAAIVVEALTLVEQDVITATDLDRVMTAGLGLRWALMGPFQTGHLNAPGGYLDYMTKFRNAWEGLFTSIGRPIQVSPSLVARIDADLRRELGESVADRQAWRDRSLKQLRRTLAQL